MLHVITDSFVEPIEYQVSFLTCDCEIKYLFIIFEATIIMFRNRLAQDFDVTPDIYLSVSFIFVFQTKTS